MTTTSEPAISAARLRAAELARRISEHHQACRDCAQVTHVVVEPGHGARRIPGRDCRTDRWLFAQLADAQTEGWPDGDAA